MQEPDAGAAMRSFLFFLALAQIAKEARGVARAAEQERSTQRLEQGPETSGLPLRRVCERAFSEVKASHG
jgi:hypothetical protein